MTSYHKSDVHPARNDDDPVQQLLRSTSDRWRRANAHCVAAQDDHGDIHE